MTLVINLIGAPGAGKSVAAMGICTAMRKDYHHAELITEAAKDMFYDGKSHTEISQLAIFAEQYKRVKRLYGSVDYIISDSPLCLSAFYATKLGYHKSFTKYALAVANEFNNINFFIKRNHRYDPNGRYQDEAGSDLIHTELKDFLYLQGIEYTNVLADDQLPLAIKNLIISKGSKI